MVGQYSDLPMVEIIQRLLLSQRTQGVRDRNGRIVIFTCVGERGFDDVDQFLVLPRLKESASQQIVTAVEVRVLRKDGPHYIHDLIVLFVGKSEPSLS